jgi:hypothetical protein
MSLKLQVSKYMEREVPSFISLAQKRAMEPSGSQWMLLPQKNWQKEMRRSGRLFHLPYKLNLSSNHI